jgi:hypothetical protein
MNNHDIPGDTPRGSWAGSEDSWKGTEVEQIASGNARCAAFRIILRCAQNRILMDLAPSPTTSRERKAIPRGNPTKGRILELLAQFSACGPRTRLRSCGTERSQRATSVPSAARYPSFIGTDSSAVLIVAMITAFRAMCMAFRTSASITRSRPVKYVPRDCRSFENLPL